ncbi:hypothetical protein N780_08525 [Pontibacillus chungwhensis BH030062]|uniref:Uncharacterized protein n=1 Tax=Pontibacillus chungwhensis BH030062 TaxID=1385513 RepID=A0A0A2UXT8_9BACI|nr:hypothetical protein [Pontibacillus chungwhensis]KGP91316.1 hypothetical protein N780_08525 [Pontibacillus chungwhensis BH030062]
MNEKYLGLTLLSFILIFSLGTMVVETLEGTKITTSEYVGLTDDLGLILFFAFYWFIAYFLFCLVGFLVNRYFHSFLLKMVLFLAISLGIAHWFFNHLYGYGDFIHEYDLNIGTFYIIFFLCGLAYSVLEHVIYRMQSK